MPRSAARRTESSIAELRVGQYARYDVGRLRRTGVPEVVLGEGKTPDHLTGLLRRLHQAGLGAIVSRMNSPQRARLRKERSRGLPVRFRARGMIAWIPGRGVGVPHRGTVAILTAGTADVALAEQARAVLELSGVRVLVAYDVGVAGLHRLQRALKSIQNRDPRAYLVFAGREGALPTVVAGLVSGPVIGVPTAVGYGRGGRGEAALTAMLQSCAPLAVLNIDAAVPAALFALRLLPPPGRTADRRLDGRSRRDGRGA